MEDSIFTRIIKGEIPAHTLYEDDDILAFLDIHPIQPGHTLVIPKAQIDHLWDLDAKTYSQLMSVARRLAQKLREKLPVERVGVQVVGNDVPHAHVHLIPFTTTKQFRNIPDMTAEPDHEALAKMAELLKL